MTLTAPLYRLKRQARRLARDKAIPLHSALDLVARQEGFSRWSLLVARHGEQNPAKLLLARRESQSHIRSAAASGRTTGQ